MKKNNARGRFKNANKLIIRTLFIGYIITFFAEFLLLPFLAPEFTLSLPKCHNFNLYLSGATSQDSLTISKI